IEESVESLIKWAFEKTVNKSWQNRWDDEELNELLDITTVVQPIEAIGKAAVQELIAQKEKAPGEQGEKREVLEASIVFRKSCRKAD
ncbi:LacI family transcriptional regulator, partial [Eubacterium sp. am_0171]|uniref:LacI family transcriptional regulator n=1 Tax=unclassified Eubacterium (in: firmicutes) TaxID=2624479 RepID=UPI0010211C01